MVRSLRVALIFVCTSSHASGLVDQLATDMRRYYVDAQWVCPSLEKMRLRQLTCAWPQVVELMTDPAISWSYFCDTPVAYKAFCQYPCATLTDFARLSMPALWLGQCQAYEQFFTSHEYDAAADIVVPVQADKIRAGSPLIGGRSVSSIALTRQTVMLSDVMATTNAPTWTSFYLFYFECAVNVFLRAIDFVDRLDGQPVPADVEQLISYKRVLERVYQKCQPLCRQADARIRRQLAFNYQRARHIWTLVCDAKHIDPYSASDWGTDESRV